MAANEKIPQFEDSTTEELRLHNIYLVKCILSFMSRHNLSKSEKAYELFDANCISNIFRINKMIAYLCKCECGRELLVYQVLQTIAVDFDISPGSYVPDSQNGYVFEKGETVETDKRTTTIIRVYPYPGDGGCKCSRDSKPDSDIQFMNLTDRFNPNNEARDRTHFDQLHRDAKHSQRKKLDEIQRYTGIYYDEDEMGKLLSFNPNKRKHK